LWKRQRRVPTPLPLGRTVTFLFSVETSLPRRNCDARWLDALVLPDLSRARFLAEAPTSSPPVKLQLLLRREWRTSEGVEEVRKILDSLGLKLTASGLATVSAEATPERFESLFGVKASGGHTTDDLTVPAPLDKYVASISVAPPHIYLQE
jgi:hypothetical protein